MISLKPFATAAAISLTALPAFAFDDSDKAALATLTESYATALSANDYATIVASQPPSYHQALADAAGAPVKVIEAGMRDEMGNQFKANGVSDFAMTFDLDAAQTGTSDQGRDYAVIPNQLIYKDEGAGFRDDGSVLAVEEDNQWYLVQMKNPDMMAYVFKAFPDLAGLEFVEPTTTELQ